MCECVRFDLKNASNGDDYNEKEVTKLNDVIVSSKANSNGLTNNSITCDKCLRSSLSSMVINDNESKCKGLVVSIESIESPTIDAVLDKVPLVYDPITKQLLLHNCINNHNKGINGVKNGFHLHNGFRKNGFANVNLKHDNTCAEPDLKFRDISESLTSNNFRNNDHKLCFNTNDSSFEDKLKSLSTDNEIVEREQSPPNLLNRNESQSIDKSLSVTNDSIKCHLVEVDDDNNSYDDSSYKNQDNVSNDDSISSLNLDECESNGLNFDLKPKKLFTLSIQSFISKVKRTTSIGSNTSVESNSNSGNSAVTNHKNSVISCVNIPSTTALILENRPPHLPAKPEEEEKKHKLEYEEMIKQVRKKELKETKLKRKLIQKQIKFEDQVIGAIKLWTNDVLPNWDKSKSSKKTRDLWWSGIPSVVRQKVWMLAINNELNLTEELYQICVNRSKEKVWTKNITKCNSNDTDDCDGESAADLIKLDVSRTFPQLGLFQKNGPYHEMLSEVLGAFVTYRPDIGYSQGMSFLAAMLLLNMENTSKAFICFSNLLNNQLLLSFFRVNQTVMNAYYQTYEEFFKENLPKLYKHFNEHKLSPDLYLVDYIYTLFSRSLPLDVATRVWDMFLRDGDQFIFRAALGILAMYYDLLLNLDFIYLAQFLTKLPDDIDSDKLFSYISGIRMTIGCEKLSFSTVLQTKLETS